MSALTDLFSSMANKIRSKTGTATTYTPPQMVSDGIDDVYDAGVAAATTPITPSDSSPVAMSANTGYKPTTNGYAIESDPTLIVPSNITPPTITNGTIYKAGRDGVAIENYDTIQPKDTPTVVSNGNFAKFTGYDAKVVKDIYDLTPSDSNPVSLLGGSNWHVSGSTSIRQGWAIQSEPASKTPSDTSPAAVTSGSIIKPSSNGYLYATQQTKGITQLGSVTIADTSNHTVSLSSSVKNFRYILVCMGGSVATNKYYNNNTGGGCGSVIIFDSDKWVSGFTLDGGYTTGNSGSQSTRTDTITYSSNTAMIIKHSNNTSRTDYIYGLN